MSGGVHITPSTQRLSVTVEEERVFHYIADEELEMLVHGEDEPMAQIFWASIGVFFGSLQGAVALLLRLPTTEATLADLVPLLLAFAGAIVAAIAGLAWRGRRRRIRSLQQRIRARHKVPVSTEAALSYTPPSGASTEPL